MISKRERGGQSVTKLSRKQQIYERSLTCLPLFQVVRVMPNTPSLVQHGATVYSLGKHATSKDSATVVSLFSGVGECFPIQVRTTLIWVYYLTITKNCDINLLKYRIYSRISRPAYKPNWKNWPKFVQIWKF